MVIGTISIFSAFFALSAVNTKYMKILLYNCRKYSTNHTFLCKTKPILKSLQFTQTLFHKELTKIFTTFGTRKTKPILKMTEINANSVLTKNYEQITTFFRKKNKANSKPISETSKNDHKLSLHKGLRKYLPLGGQKNKANSNPILIRQKHPFTNNPSQKVAGYSSGFEHLNLERSIFLFIDGAVVGVVTDYCRQSLEHLF